MARMTLPTMMRRKKAERPQGLKGLRARTQGVGRVLAVGVLGSALVAGLVIGIYTSATQGVTDIQEHGRAIQDVRRQIISLQDNYNLNDLRDPLLMLGALTSEDTFLPATRLPLLDARGPLVREADAAFEDLVPALFAEPIARRLATLLREAKTVPEIHRYISIAQLQRGADDLARERMAYEWLNEDLETVQLPQPGKARARQEIMFLFDFALTYGGQDAWRVDPDVIEEAKKRASLIPAEDWLYQAVLDSAADIDAMFTDLRDEGSRTPGRPPLIERIAFLDDTGVFAAPRQMARATGASLLATLPPAFRPGGQEHVLASLDADALADRLALYQETLGIDANTELSLEVYGQAAAQRYEEDLLEYWSARLADMYLIPPGDPSHALDQLALLLPADVGGFNLRTNNPLEAARAQGGLMRVLVQLSQDLGALRYKDQSLAEALGFAPGWEDAVRESLGQLQERATEATALNIRQPDGTTFNLKELALSPQARVPDFVNTWLLDYDAALTAVINPRARGEVFNARWQTGALAQCLAVSKLYPFTFGNAPDAPLDQTARVFAPYGVIPAFFASLPPEVQAFLSEGQQSWDLIAEPSAKLGLIRRHVNALRVASNISVGFDYQARGDRLAYEFSARPLDLDQRTTRASLSFGLRSATATNNGADDVVFQWPPISGTQEVTLTFEGLRDANQPPPVAGWSTQTLWPISRLMDLTSDRAGVESQLLLEYSLDSDSGTDLA
ncbi:MAG: hypothetical protein AAFR93_08555, partial [Pseudomonadota bacterium]